MIDELPILDKLDKIEKGLSYMAGYDIKSYLLSQSLTKIKKLYGQYESILDGYSVRIAFAPNNIDIAEEISKSIGNMTIMKKEDIKIKGRWKKKEKEIRRRLITPEEIMQLKVDIKEQKNRVIEGGKMLIFITGLPVIKGTKLLSFKDSIFFGRSEISPVLD